ncbi:MAG: MGH1-like glycoside hydrolase domain-containing protein [Longimicrobiales bacterium]
MRSPRLLGPSLALLLAGSGLISCSGGPASILEHQKLLQGFDWWDNKDWDWYEEKIPFFESPDPDLDATYYYRWEVLTKHLVYGSPQSGYTFTEFIDRPFWAGSYGAISCPLGHQAYEIRWLKDRRVIEDFARYWFETPGAEPRSYSNWYGDAMWATYEVLGDREILGKVYPHMEAQVAGWMSERWDPEHEMFRWVGAWDGMETNINSRLTDDEFGGAEGYRPTLNSYLYADMLAISKTAALLGDSGKGEAYAARAAALKTRVQEELWDPDREFFFHQFAFDEKDGIRAGSLTYETGPFAGNPHGRELLGYVPWQFHLPDPGYESAWRFLMDPDFFWAPFGPTGVEQEDPQFFVSPRCCVWSGNAWPYATAQTLTAMANLLHDYEQEVVTRADYYELLRTYARGHRQNGRPYIAEAADPYSGSWAGHNIFYHSEHYLHSGFLDQVITGLVGLRPRADDTLRVNPLVPEAWDYFALEGVEYHGYELTVVWDRNGIRYGRGSGLRVYLDGREIAMSPGLREIRTAIPPPAPRAPAPRPKNYAVNNDGAHFPFASASASHPLFPPFYAVDGNRWYHPSPPNRWVSGEWMDPGGLQARVVDGPAEGVGAVEEGQPRPGSGEGEIGDPASTTWFQVDFGAPRPITEVRLYFLDDSDGPAIEAVGEERLSGYPLQSAGSGPTVLPPHSYEVKTLDGSAWVEVPGQRRNPADPTGRRANSVRFPEIHASGIRVELHPREGATVGLTEVEAWGPGSLPLPEPSDPVPNLALNREREGFPRVVASFTYRGDSVWEAVDGRLALTRYSRSRWTAFESPNREDWLEVDFGRPEEVQWVDLFLYGDGRGVAAPQEYRFEAWTGSRWEPAGIRSRTPERPMAWALNQVELEPVRTDRLRVVFRHAHPAATGLAEIRVFPSRTLSPTLDGPGPG